MQMHLKGWVEFLEEKVLRRPLLPDEYLFPHVSPNGQVNTAKAMDHSVLQKTLDDFSSGSGLNVKFTSHCFRRGGAQYRYIHCPAGERWSLSMVKWWGGWADGEQVSTGNIHIGL